MYDDKVGDPFKDTSGPSMNILIKLSTIVALIIAPHIAKKTNLKTYKESVEEISNHDHKHRDHSGNHHHDGHCCHRH